MPCLCLILPTQLIFLKDRHIVIFGCITKKTEKVKICRFYKNMPMNDCLKVKYKDQKGNRALSVLVFYVASANKTQI